MKRGIPTLLVLLSVACATGPAGPANRYGLPVVSDPATYQELVRRDPDKELVDVARAVPLAVLDVRYATANNFMHQLLYPVARVFLRLPAARALADVQRELGTEGLGLKVFDAYRPYRVTERMWEAIRNPDFVADPAKGSRHNRGAAVDLTLIHLRTGAELPMPTPYDDFTSRARQDFSDLPAEVVTNRTRLREVMQRYGFVPLASEWWHFDFHNYDRFELMDLDLITLAAIVDGTSLERDARPRSRAGMESEAGHHGDRSDLVGARGVVRRIDLESWPGQASSD